MLLEHTCTSELTDHVVVVFIPVSIHISDCVVYHSIVMFMGESAEYISPFVEPLPTMHRGVHSLWCQVS